MTSNLIIIGIDPGLSTGMGILWNGTRHGVMQGPPARIIQELQKQLDLMMLLSDREIRIGIERFITTPETGKKSQQSTALEVIGAVTHVATEAGVPIHKQTVSHVKKLTSNRRLRELGLYVTARDVNQPDANDANDAMRHAVYCTAIHHATAFVAMLERARLIR